MGLCFISKVENTSHRLAKTRWYGETEFYISILKVILIFGLFLFTFITMVGGNPLHDVYGFRCVGLRPMDTAGMVN